MFSIALIVGLQGSHTTAWAQLVEGRVWTWGANTYGQLGNGTICYPTRGTNCSSGMPVQVIGLGGVKTVRGGFAHSLALKYDGTVWAWGNNMSGEFGNGYTCPNQSGPNPNTSCYSTAPVQVLHLTDVSEIAVGQCGLSGFNLARKADGTVWAWGCGGALGNGTYNGSNVPVQVVDPANHVDGKLHDVIAISAGHVGIAMALKSNLTVWTWGANLGNGAYCCSATPVQVPGLPEILRISAGASSSFAIGMNGTVWSWGANFYGTLGNGANADSNLPVQVIDPTDASGFLQKTSYKAPQGHGLVVMMDGTLRAWGSNQYGELGNGTKMNSNVPVKVSGSEGAGVFFGAFAVAQTNTGSLALSTRGTVHAWGDNRQGQVGNSSLVCDPNTRVNCTVTSPVQVSNLNTVAAIGTGAFHNLAVIGKYPTFE